MKKKRRVSYLPFNYKDDYRSSTAIILQFTPQRYSVY